jgi:hypothetical protein
MVLLFYDFARRLPIRISNSVRSARLGNGFVTCFVYASDGGGDMQGLAVVGIASYSGGFLASNTAAVDFCCLTFFLAGTVLIGTAFWFLRKAPVR